MTTCAHPRITGDRNHAVTTPVQAGCTWYYPVTGESGKVLAVLEILAAATAAQPSSYTTGVRLVLRLAVLATCCAGVFVPLAGAQPDDAGVLPRIHAYVDKFQRELPSIVAEEHYLQVLTIRSAMAREVRSTERELRSDILMITVPGTIGWVSFRDVFEVDGRRVRDREDRLLALLQSPNASGMAQARRLADESARYNLGRVHRTVNLPDSALVYLQAAFTSRMKFEAPQASDPVDGAETVVLRFRETGRPTIVTARRGANIPATGRVWAHAATGTIVKTELSLSDISTDGRFIVEFAKDERSGLRLPAKMTERHTSPGEEIRATAEYSNVRRFNVLTDETLRKPPG